MAETTRLRILHQPGYIEALLESFVRRLDFLPETAERVTDPAQLAPALGRVAGTSHDRGGAWCCWTDGARAWFFTAEMSLEQSRERGRAVLRISSYDAEGELVESGWWARSPKGWHRCLE